MTDVQIENQEKKSYTLFAQNIVSATGKSVFKKDKALSCLAKADIFFKELTGCFNKLNFFQITPEKFDKAVLTLPDSTDKNRLQLCSEVYKNYIEVMTQNGYKIPFAPREIKRININLAKNPEIKQRLELLRTIFEEKKNAGNTYEKSESVDYFEFSDIQNECQYVINQIKTGVAKQNLSYKDFAVFVDKTESRQKFADMLKAEGVPVVSSIYNENYENLKHKVEVYEKISAICEELHLEEFNSESFKNLDLTANLNYLSKSQKEICLERLDDVMKSLAEEIFTDSYTTDKLLNLKEKTHKSLTETMFVFFNVIKESEKEQLIQEFGAIKGFYAHYRENRYANAIETVIMRFFKLFDEQKELKEAVAGKIKSLNELQDLYDKVLKEPPEFGAFKEILQWLPQDTQKDDNAVRLASISAGFKEEEVYKHIFVSGLTENNFPGNNTSYPFISESTNYALNIELRKINPHYNSFLQTDETYFSQRYFAVCEVMCRAVENITFTTHSYETKKSVQPSVFFKVLKSKDEINFKKFEEEVLTTDTEKIGQMAGCVRFAQEKTKEKVISDEEVLWLNPSSINSFQRCPRKYYYKNLLNLKESSNFSASYGTIAHAVFEVMNKNHLDNYCKEKALELGGILFNTKNDPQKVLESGFDEYVVDLISATDDLSLREMEENFKNAIENFEEHGYFDKTLVNAVCEKEFCFKLEELPNIVFDGRIDAILSNKNGETMIVDYKTGKNKTNSLDYAITENGVNFLTKDGSEPKNIEEVQRNYDYQIPVYYLACQNSKSLEEFKDKITELGLIYVRPQNKENGCKKDFVTAENLKLYKDKIVQNLKETVIDKIKSESEFEPLCNFWCADCSYNFLCGGGSNDDE